MLYLNPPYYTIDGVTLMPDHEDPLQFYYMPMSPHLSVMKEGDLKIPKIQVIKFTGRPTPTSDVISGNSSTSTATSASTPTTSPRSGINFAARRASPPRHASHPCR